MRSTRADAALLTLSILVVGHVVRAACAADTTAATDSATEPRRIFREHIQIVPWSDATLRCANAGVSRATDSSGILPD
eukprot:CAMPEP_0185581910 /NCGR_PEP_ID=MMETSP0434-20130131/19309_1 /TAXON_ID=626734 ORGANISM="Favella taraikaensis, Strain Fe Narragansett Bay" /NCGR_SAMPLE_ID=MMETSP0434 /ASSEMBLY_ACC=CAM_ASM_000379 /LENGTH=77 /DNA_ID=CAMNT_0028200571 /DNA_START=768 /DNA_END=1001 /DNA_ORIENTATION=-